MDRIRAQLCDCVADVSIWCASRRLQLNAAKTELIWFSSRANLAKISNYDLSITADNETISPVSVVRDLGVMLDGELNMMHHIGVVTRACFHQIRRLRQIRRRVGQDITEKLVLALTIPRLDYCNSVLAGLPAVTTEPLQRVQNAAARLIFISGHVTMSLIV